jgi:hypothetical protein
MVTPWGSPFPFKPTRGDFGRILKLRRPVFLKLNYFMSFPASIT